MTNWKHITLISILQTFQNPSSQPDFGKIGDGDLSYGYGAFWVKRIVERDKKHEIGFFIAVVNYCVLSKFACFPFLCHRESCLKMSILT